MVSYSLNVGGIASAIALPHSGRGTRQRQRWATRRDRQPAGADAERAAEAPVGDQIMVNRESRQSRRNSPGHPQHAPIS